MSDKVVPTPAAAPKTILLVEDEPLLMLTEKFLLQKHGFRVITAANGAAAVEIALNTPELDLILMDITLEADLDGVEAAQQILQQRELPIVFLSCHTEPEIVAKTEDVTSYGYVVKHSGETVLLASIKMAFKLFTAHQWLKQQEEALRESEARFRAIADYTYDWESWHDAQGQVVWINPMVTQHTGYSVVECLTMPDYPLPMIAPDDRERIGTLLQKALREKTSGNDVPFRFRRKDQTIGWMSISWQPAYNSHGRYIGIRSSMRDITGRKQAEEELKRYRQIVSSTLDGIAFVDGEYRYRIVNDAYERVSGVSRDRFLGLTVAEYLGDEVFQQQVKPYFDRCLQGETVHYQEWFQYPTLGKRFVEVTYFPYRDARQQIAGIVANSRDITDRKQAEEALQEQMRLNQILLDAFPCVALLIRPHSHDIVAANKAAAQVGATPGTQCFAAWWHRNDPCPWCLAPQVWATGAAQHLEIEALGTVWEAHWIPVEKDVFMHYAIDITDRKRMEEALRASERQMQELNASKDKFFAILSHDLKNPLAGFLSFAKLLEKDFEGRPAAERLRQIQNFRVSAEMLFALLENLLTWSQLQRGVMTYTPQPLVLNWIVARNVELFTPQAAQKQITLTQTVPAISVQGDFNMVDAVIRNLLSNAIKFTPPGGAVDITATHAAAEVTIRVADTGIGMSADYLTQVFQIEAKTQRTGTAGEKGTGLGLILCQEFAARHGGRLWVESEVGKGTTVVFILPAKAHNMT